MQLLRTINLLLIYQCGMLSSVRATQQLLALTTHTPFCTGHSVAPLKLAPEVPTQDFMESPQNNFRF